MKFLNMKSLKLFLLFLFALPLLTQVKLEAQKYKSGPQDMVFFSSVDETDQPYSIYVPKNFDESRKYPLVVFLHGAMSNNRLGLMRAFGQGNLQGPEFGTQGFVPPVTDLEATRSFPVLKDVDYIVAAPLARGTAGYQGIPEQDVFDMLADIKSKFNIDEDRMYLTGLSMGGGGTLWIGLTRPDLWAAIAPVCPAPPEDLGYMAGNAFNYPVHLFVGDRDGLMNTADTYKGYFETNKVKTEYVIYPGIAHNSWEYAYKDGFIFDWFAQFRRDPFPQEVKFSTKSFKYNKAYWVKFDNFVPGTVASIDARFTANNTIEVTTSGLDAFSLNLNGHSMFKATAKVDVRLDGKVFSVKTADAVSFSKKDGVWVNQKFTPGLFSKQQGAEGPAVAAVNGNHIYVYGTQGNPTPEELQARRAQAAMAADWAADRGMGGRIMIFPRVVADNGVRQSDLVTSNLVLLGTAETNSIIKKYADRLPVQLNADVKDYGLLYIFPMNGHYILVSSGLPWWTPAAPKEGQPAASGMSLMSGKASALAIYKDFILFKSTRDNIISEGYFDNNWALPAAEAAKLKASGVVTVK
jgi:pimeloyl-ACP methyl ester carboxylesterase